MEWYSLGVFLKIPDHKLDEIKISNQFSNDPKTCKVGTIILNWQSYLVVQ